MKADKKITIKSDKKRSEEQKSQEIEHPLVNKLAELLLDSDSKPKSYVKSSKQRLAQKMGVNNGGEKGAKIVNNMSFGQGNSSFQG